MLQDQKIGHYMHVPPKAIFFSQIFGELIGVPINYGVIQWVVKAKRDYLLGDKEDPLGQWTGQLLANYNTMGVQYVLIGPKRLFAQHMYKPLPWAFLYGALAPIALYALHRAFPKSKLKFHLCKFGYFPLYPRIISSPLEKPVSLTLTHRERDDLRHRRFAILWQSVYGLHQSLHCRLHLHVLLLQTPLRDLEALQLSCRCSAGCRLQHCDAAHVHFLQQWKGDYDAELVG